MTKQYRDVINSARVLEKTRHALMARLESNGDHEPRAIRRDLYTVLQAVVGRLIPQEFETPIDICARLDEQHFKNKGDGWRYADMPPDKEALQIGLKYLDDDSHRTHQKGFAEIEFNQRDLLLAEVQQGVADWPLNSKRWFEQVLADAISIFVSHPDTLEKMGFSGIAILPKWERIGLNNTEPWEPKALLTIRGDSERA